MTPEIRPRGTHLTYRPDIDGLRAVAVLSVVAFHAFPNSLKGGFIGVDIFFVISGYLISTIVFANLERRSFSILDFYNRRIRRIFPALITVMAASLVFGWFVLFSDEYRQLAKHIMAGSAFLANIALYRESGYFDNAAETKPMLHLWSLAVEEQFYIFWPLMLAFVRKYNWSFLPLTSALAVLSFAINLYLLTWNQSAAFYWPIARFWELMIGGLLAFAALHRPELLKWKTNAQSIVGIGLLAAGLLVINKDMPFPGWWTLLPTVGSALMISAGSTAWINKYLLSNRPMVWIGLISYPLYLWHWPLLSFIHIVDAKSQSHQLIPCAVLLAFALAWITYLFEKRVRSSLNRHTAIILLFLLAIVAFTSHRVFANDGFRERAIAAQFKFSESDKSLFDKSRYSDGSCVDLDKLSLLPEEVCLSNSTAPRVLFAGDSHALSLYGSIYAKRVPIDSILIAGYGCPLYPNLEYTPEHKLSYGNNCTAISNKALQIALASKPLETIVLSNIVPYYSSKDGDKKSVYRLSGRQLTKREAFEFGTGYLVSELLKSGKKVVFVIDVPQLKADPRDCVQRLSFMAPKPCEYSSAENFDERKDYLQAVDGLRRKFVGLEVFDPTGEFCHEGWCHFKDKDDLLYADFHHISIFASEKLLSQMQSEDYLAR